jgi:hypothetical protein
MARAAGRIQGMEGGGVNQDPCFRCTLKDCDEKHPQCAVRLLHRRYQKKVRAGRHGEVTDEEREANNRTFQFWQLERRAEASEGGRAFRRGTRTIGAEVGR